MRLLLDTHALLWFCEGSAALSLAWQDAQNPNGISSSSPRLRGTSYLGSIVRKDHQPHRGCANFEWQGGYADFSVSQSYLEKAKQYIASQEGHHRKQTFQDELRVLLKKHEIECNERYVWD